MLHASFQEAIACLGGLKPEPELAERSSPERHTPGLRGGALCRGDAALVDGFSAAETQAVLGHELGHPCARSFGSPRLDRFYLPPPPPGVGAAAERLQQERRRAAEFSAPRRLLVTQDAAVVSLGAHQARRQVRDRRRRGVPPAGAGKRYDGP